MLKPPKNLTGTLSIFKEMHLSWWVLAAPYCCTLCSSYKRWASWVELNVSRASASFPDSHSASLASFHSPPVTQRYQNLHHGSSSQQTSDTVLLLSLNIILYHIILLYIVYGSQSTEMISILYTMDCLFFVVPIRRHTHVNLTVSFRTVTLRSHVSNNTYLDLCHDRCETYPFFGIFTEEVWVDCKIKGPESIYSLCPWQSSLLHSMCGKMLPLQPAEKRTDITEKRLFYIIEPCSPKLT